MSKNIIGPDTEQMIIKYSSCVWHAGKIRL